jgi:soluble lytic murein transglycosylase
MMRLILIISSILFSSAIFSLSLDQQRTVYSEALQLQVNNNWDEAKDKLDSIPLYPLTYILEYQQLKKEFSLGSVVEINNFINNNKRYKISDQLQREYLYYLAGKKYWAEFVSFYPQLPRSEKLKCFYFQAKMEMGDDRSIWPDVKKTWLKGRSQPNACDNVFNYYLKKNNISQALIWQRYELAFQRNKKPLMNYLIGLMEGKNKTLAKQLYALNKNTKKLSASGLFTHREQASYSFVKPLLKRLAREDIKLALKTYTAYEGKIPFTSNDEIQLKKYFAYRILIDNKKKLLPWLDDALLYLADVKLTEQRIRYAIKYNNWADIELWIGALPQENAQKTTWVYWQARAFEQKKQFKKANALYLQIAGKRKYYSFS